MAEPIGNSPMISDGYDELIVLIFIGRCPP